MLRLEKGLFVAEFLLERGVSKGFENDMSAKGIAGVGDAVSVDICVQHSFIKQSQNFCARFLRVVKFGFFGATGALLLLGSERGAEGLWLEGITIVDVLLEEST